ncbi:MAG: hypothetical protein KKB82_03225, partial [Candidatus Omnitrophica bacterium]|nr:hypothetical protein [Candidatus Omnitrophota bacterium]
KHDLMCLLKDLKKSGKVIFGYGASGRANTIIQYCHISDDILDCIIDDASAKHGFYMPGSHFAIKTRDFFKAKPPDYVLLFAWSFLKEIVDKNIDYLHQGGKFIIPLPKVKIISWSNGEIVEKLYEDLA